MSEWPYLQQQVPVVMEHRQNQDSETQHIEVPKRLEDFRFLVGKANYVDDFKFEKMAFLGIVRSPYAHAKVDKIDFSDARVDPELIDVITGEELVTKEGVNPLFETQGQRKTGRYHLAYGKTRYVGEGVAAIVARHKYSVEDLIERVSVEYTPLEPISDVSRAKEAKSLVYDEWGNNIARRQAASVGDTDAALKSSANMITARLGIKRQAGAAIEPRSVIARYHKDSGVYEIHVSAQSANSIQDYVMSELGVPKSKVHVLVKDVGGGFGVKGSPSYPEVVLCCIFARRTGYSIKWTSTRTEDMLESVQGRDQYCDIELGVDSNAKIVGLRARVEVDLGVAGTLTSLIENTVMLLPCVYKIPNFDIQGICYTTNKTPTSPVRGNGRPESCFFIERAIDIMANYLKLDPVEFRRRNLIQPSEFPYQSGTGHIYDSGNFPLLLDTLVKAANYDELKVWRAKVNGSLSDRTTTRVTKIAGIGICMQVEDTGKRLTETAKVVASADGFITVFTGSSPHGQGHETTLAQLCSEELRFPLNRIRVVWGDTQLIPNGRGTFGSRSAVTGGSAVIEACRKLREKIIQRAASISNLKPEDLYCIGEEIIVKGGITSDNTFLMTLGELADRTGEIDAYFEFTLKSLPIASGAHLCTILLDRETGKIEIRKYVAVDDCGRIINHTIVDGQMHGGIAHGIGGALLEQVLYSEDGQPMSNSFMDYTIPTAIEIPNILVLHIETPSPFTPSGAKGVGESGTIGAYPALLNALNDALSEVGSSLNIAPATPESVVKAINNRTTS